MARLAAQLKANSVCGQDFEAANPAVIQAFEGFIAYQPLYQAGCLKDDSGQYCTSTSPPMLIAPSAHMCHLSGFANAITNTTSTSDAYPYYIPLGVALPGGSRPTCNQCLQKTMGIFATAASNATQPVSQTYGNAAQQINIGCGPDFVNDTVQIKSGAAMLFAYTELAPFVVLFMLLFALLN